MTPVAGVGQERLEHLGGAGQRIARLEQRHDIEGRRARSKPARGGGRDRRVGREFRQVEDAQYVPGGPGEADHVAVTRLLTEAALDGRCRAECGQDLGGRDSRHQFRG